MSTVQSPTGLADRAANHDLAISYGSVRDMTEKLAEPLRPEDQVVQSMPDVSPTKWHRAHTTWFFETFLLRTHHSGYRVLDDRYEYLFNSYYEAVGPRHPRPERGMLSRPTVDEVSKYRQHVDDAMIGLLGEIDDGRGGADGDLASLVALGLHHEQQHQELLLMDIKHVLSLNPLEPAYRPAPGSRPHPASGQASRSATRPRRWFSYEGGQVTIGHGARSGRSALDGFTFDNEGPRHDVLLRPFELADRLVTCGEWLEFMQDGGYQRPELWLSDGWYAVQGEDWHAPLYWRHRDGEWWVHTLHGTRRVVEAEPVTHVSHYEADAFARWAGARLPTEAEWEHAAVRQAVLCRDPMPAGILHPVAAAAGAASGAGAGAGAGAASAGAGLQQLFGEVWQWTCSPYVGYPGFQPATGAVGEYNGKFMSNQMVLRGGSCATPPGHTRHTYRNFFPPGSRWMFSGVRLARS